MILIGILVFLLIIAVIVLFVSKGGKNAGLGPRGPQGRVGAPGPTGNPGGTGSNGSQGPFGPIGATGSVGPRGPQGPGTGGGSADARTFTFNVIQAQDNVNFGGGLQTKDFRGIQETTGKVVTDSFANVTCFVTVPNTTDFFLRFTLGIPLTQQSDIVSFEGFAAQSSSPGTSGIPIFLVAVTVLDSLNVRCRFLTTNGIIWNGSGSAPPMSVFLTLNYIAPSLAS